MTTKLLSQSDLNFLKPKDNIIFLSEYENNFH